MRVTWRKYCRHTMHGTPSETLQSAFYCVISWTSDALTDTTRQLCVPIYLPTKVPALCPSAVASSCTASALSFDYNFAHMPLASHSNAAITLWCPNMASFNIICWSSKEDQALRWVPKITVYGSKCQSNNLVPLKPPMLIPPIPMKQAQMWLYPLHIV